jgi:hypothetical protein
MKNKLTPLILLLFVALPMFSQEISWQEFNEERLRINRVGMQVLGGWAIANFAISGISVWQSTGEVKAFHQMNLGWNAVNITLATFGYFNALNGDTDLGSIESIRAHESIMRIFLFNAGLDLGYIMGGAYLVERSKNVTKNSERLSGFGKSIIMQGAFLMLFDGIMYFAHLHHENNQLAQLISGLSFGPQGVRYTLNF